MTRRARAQKTRRWGRILAAGLIVLVIVIAIAGLRSGGGGPAPALAGPAVSGTSLALAARPGEPVLVHFWATWCPTCRAGHESIDELAREHRVLTVASQSGGAGNVAAHLREEGVEFPVIVDRTGALARQWRVRAFPTSFVVDGDGEIRSTVIGLTSSTGLASRIWLARLL